jgi:hypothetical protein
MYVLKSVLANLRKPWILGSIFQCWVFGFAKKDQFWFSNISELEIYQFQFSEKEFRIEELTVLVVSKPQGTSGFHERTSGFVGSYLIFSKKLRTEVIDQELVL